MFNNIWSTGLTTDGALSLETILRERNELIRRIQEVQQLPATQGIVLGWEERDGQRYLVSYFGGGRVTKSPVGDWARGAKPGMCVIAVTNTLAPIAFAPPQRSKCRVAVVKEKHDGFIAYAVGMDLLTVSCDLDVEVGDRVLLDADLMVAIEKMPKQESSPTKKTSAETGVSWDDIGGLAEAKRLLREAIEEPLRHPDVYRRFGKKRVKGVALVGPPGTGKTLLARACASSLARSRGKSASDTGFIYVKGPEILSHLVGDSEANVRAIFDSARAHHAKHGYPALVFLDEADGILTRRGAGLFHGMERTIVPAFLAEMDGLEDGGALVLFATNRPLEIDPAFLRDGRIDRKIEVGRPSKEDAADIFEKLLKGKPFAGTPKACAERLYAPKHVLWTTQGKEGRERVTLGDVATGATMLGVVERATQRAIRRALAGEEGATIEMGDVEEAIAEVVAEEQAIRKPTT
jgi:ATP-dependent 26S proteasome regulatory subunit